MKNKSNNLVDTNTLMNSAIESGDEGDGWERKVMSYPLTPDRYKRYNNDGKNN